MKENDDVTQKVDILQEKIDKAFMEVGLTPNWVNKVGTMVTIPTGVKISTSYKGIEKSKENKN